MPVIAVDGPAASGKGTLSRALATRLNFAYLDTGKLYRAVAFYCLETGLDEVDREQAVEVAQNLDTSGLASLIESGSLDGETVASLASKVAAIPDVRQALLEFQRQFARIPPPGKQGAILDGRDIGTVICPDADVKIFVTATAESRALRRYREGLDKGEQKEYEQVLQEVKDRDYRDESRTNAPLRPAADAFVLDTSGLDITSMVDKAHDIVKGVTDKA